MLKISLLLILLICNTLFASENNYIEHLLNKQVIIYFKGEEIRGDLVGIMNQENYKTKEISAYTKKRVNYKKNKNIENTSLILVLKTCYNKNIPNNQTLYIPLENVVYIKEK